MKKQPKNLQEYYKYYLSLHKISVLYNWYWYLIPVIPFVVYPFAWTGHYMFEKNKPAAFKDPVKAKISDWMMFRDILLGKIKIF